MDIGFVGLTGAGLGIALKLARSGLNVVVWDSAMSNSEPLSTAGVTVAHEPAEVLTSVETVVLMLRGHREIDDLFQRETPEFAQRVRGKTIVQMTTTPPEYSRELEAEVRAAGSSYVEAVLCGLHQSAEQSELVALLAGDDAALARVHALLAPALAHHITCGPVPSAIQMQLAANLFVATMVAGLAEAFHFAQEHGLDVDKFRKVVDRSVLGGGPSRARLDNLVAGKFDPHAAVDDVLMNSTLAARAAVDARIATPLLDRAYDLYWDARGLGHGKQDMAAVLFAIMEQTRMVRTV